MERQVKEFNLTSGFKIGVAALPPYYRDMIDARFPLPKYPMRKLTLAGGDVVDWLYSPPDEVPNEDDEDHDLFIKWHIAHKKIKEITDERNTARVNYLLNMCITVISGPIEFEDTESWAYKLEDTFPGFEVPEEIGKRMLLFLKHFVITTLQELNQVITASTAPEVTMQSISSALSGFPDHVEKGRIGGDNSEEIARNFRS